VVQLGAVATRRHEVGHARPQRRGWCIIIVRSSSTSSTLNGEEAHEARAPAIALLEQRQRQRRPRSPATAVAVLIVALLPMRGTLQVERVGGVRDGFAAADDDDAIV
jgi:hypothetical protein